MWLVIIVIVGSDGKDRATTSRHRHRLRAGADSKVADLSNSDIHSKRFRRARGGHNKETNIVALSHRPASADTNLRLRLVIINHAHLRAVIRAKHVAQPRTLQRGNDGTV